MANDRKLNRRRFLEATGAAALTASMAGCAGDGDGDGDGDGEQTTTEEDQGEYTPSETYPYGANETNVEEAQAVMEEAGYGPDNRFELDWLQYQSPAWEEMANTIRSRLDSAYIDMNISDADFGQLLNQTEQGEHMAYTLGWIADYPSAQNFLQLIDPENTVYDAEGYQPNGSRLFWSEDALGDDRIREYMTAQFDRIQNNPAPSEEAQEIRDDAAVKMERAMWDSAGLLPIYHTVDQLFWYDHVDYDPPGGMGPSRAKASTSVQGLDAEDGTLNTSSGTFNSLDPIASGNTASGDKVMDMFDAPMNYHNGTTDVRNLLVTDYSVNEDATVYEFTLKEGIQFHGDYGEVTADDVVYSFRRLVESDNSTNTYFPISVLNIDREEDEDGNIVPDSVAVEATGDYTFQITLRNPFAHTLPVLAYSAFSVVPEGIVGDIEGYEGEMEWEEFSTNPVGCGPFVFENWESGNGGEFAATKFEDYHGPEPAMDRIHDAIITEPSANYNYFLNENADVSGIPTSQYDPSLMSLEGGEGQQMGTYGPIGDGKTVNMSQTPSINTYFVGFNMEKVPKAVRQAMAYVINHEQFITNVFKERGESAFHLTPPQAYPGGAEAYNQYVPE